MEISQVQTIRTFDSTTWLNDQRNKNTCNLPLDVKNDVIGSGNPREFVILLIKWKINEKNEQKLFEDCLISWQRLTND